LASHHGNQKPLRIELNPPAESTGPQTDVPEAIATHTRPSGKAACPDEQEAAGAAVKPVRSGRQRRFGGMQQPRTRILGNGGAGAGQGKGRIGRRMYT